MTVTGKALTEPLYGTAPRYSYFNGCSTGGRQGLMEAQRYPQDYNGIMAGAPAINWPKLMMQSLWGSVQRMPRRIRSLNASWWQRRWRPFQLAMLSMALRMASSKIRSDAPSIQRRLWVCKPANAARLRKQMRTSFGSFGKVQRVKMAASYGTGSSRGADLSALAASRGTPLKAQGFTFTVDWLRSWITQNPQLDWTTITPPHTSTTGISLRTIWSRDRHR